MKLPVVRALALMLCLNIGATSEGSIETGLVKTSDLTDWVCDAKIQIHDEKSPSYCGVARFRECGACDTLVIRNNSNSTIDIGLRIKGEGFWQSGPGSFGIVCLHDESRRSALPGCHSLPPGANCFETLEFCPERSGESKGLLNVTLSTARGKREISYALVGDADYTARQKAADAVRLKYLRRLMKNPNVRKVSLNYFKGEIAIDVEVPDAEDIPEVRKSTPAELDGYRVIVTRYIPRERAL